MFLFDDAGLLPAATELSSILLDRQSLMATSESCTGGLLAALFTSIAGSSNWFERGFVTYSNQAKIENLGVADSTIDQFGAVSEQTAMEMASGLLLKIENVDLGLSTTGIAGPGGGTPGKPVGMVCFGIAKRTADGISSRAFTHVLEGNRNTIRQTAVKIIIQAAIQELQDSPK